jgi:type IV pilus assembly protein PilY1
MLTWDPVAQKAESFEWGSLTAAQQASLNAGDGTGSNRVSYLRGVTTNEISSTGTGTYRARDAILSDIVDSSPTWIGPPQDPYTLVPTWIDQLYPLVSQPENATGAQTYLQYMTPKSTTSTPANPNGAQQRANIVYAGANDGFLHGFRAGALDINGNLVTSTANDGQEVFAYMPGAVLNNIHPVDVNGNVVSQLDFTNTQYSHNWFVDATPAQGDVFYNNAWHTWVVSGLGPGGAAIFALDVTDPTQFSESNASKLVIGEWNPTTLTCAQQSVKTCGVNLGNTYGTPVIRRFHNGQWGFIFGNGYGTANGASGIYIALLDGSTGAPTFYYFPTKLTPNAATPNGIAYTSSADFDLDHTIDYIYAGDLLGNLWRFDVTSQSPANWGVSTSSPLFNAAGPITTQVQVSTVKTITTVTNSVGLDVSNAPQRVIINFGTGQQVPQTLNSAAIYASGSQSLFGIWDWDMGTPATTGWNALSPNQQALGLTGAQSTTLSDMTEQTLTETPSVTTGGVTTGGTATLTKLPVCWKGSGTCTGANTQMGWYTPLPGVNEQIIFNPFVDASGGELIYNTYTPSPSGVLSCSQVGATGFSLGMDASTGAGLNLPLFNVGGTSYDGVQNNATGTGSVVNTGATGGGKNWLITHSADGAIHQNQLNNYTVTTGQRTYWIQKR